MVGSATLTIEISENADEEPSGLQSVTTKMRHMFVTATESHEDSKVGDSVLLAAQATAKRARQRRAERRRRQRLRVDLRRAAHRETPAFDQQV